MDSAITGVIAPADQALAAVVQAADDGNQITAAAIQSATQAIQDLPLPQWPEDMDPVESPELVLARKISDDSQTHGTLPAGMPGLNGGAPSDAQSVLGGAPADTSGLLGGADTGISHAVAQVHSTLDQASGVLGGAASAGAAQAAQAVQQAASTLQSTPVLQTAAAALPADPVAALMSGLALPALPGIDQLFKPILDLLSSFGTGVLGALNPAQILSQSSEIIETAMQLGKGSMATVEQVWEGQAARNAQTASQQANTQGQETSQRGFDISDLTKRAADVVQQGNTQLVGIASSFAGQAVALAPVILTPPAQTALIASATEHLGNAVTVANATRGDLAGKTAELNGMVSQLLGQSGMPSAQEVAQAAAENLGEPLLSKAQDASTDTAGFGGSDSSSGSQLGSQAATTPQSAGHGSGASTGALGALATGRAGGGSSGRVGGVGGHGSGSGSGAGSSTAKPNAGLPGSTVSPLRGGAGLSGGSFGAGAGGAGGTSGSGNSFMGSPAAAGGQRGGDDDQHSRTVQPYQSRTGNDDLTGPLGESTPDVIGAPHSDELLADYEQDQF